MVTLKTDREFSTPRDANQNARCGQLLQEFGDVVQQTSERKNISTLFEIHAGAAAIEQRYIPSIFRELTAGLEIPATMALNPMDDDDCAGRLLFASEVSIF